jgi:hypothetical protein
VSQDELIILVVVLIAWGSGRRPSFSTESFAPIAGGAGINRTAGRQVRTPSEQRRGPVTFVELRIAEVQLRRIPLPRGPMHKRCA